MATIRQQTGCLISIGIGLIVGLTLVAPAQAFRLTVDPVNGGNPKLAKGTYKVYIQGDPTNNNRRTEVQAALDKWKVELAARGIDLQLQAGDPPQQPLDLAKYNQEVQKYNADPNPNPANYPEMAKYDAKKNSISVYWTTSQDIQNRGGGGTEKGLAESVWGVDGNGKADKIEISDIFLPTDPPGGTENIKKLMIHNIALHEFAHPAGLDHYTPKQNGEVMQTDATLFTDKLNLGTEETKALDAIYGQKPKVNVNDGAKKKESALLPSYIRDQLPTSLGEVWEYTYDLAWSGGSHASYFQVDVDSMPVYLALGTAGLEDWLVDMPAVGERYLEFYADSVYLGDSTSTGTLLMYSTASPGLGWLVHAGGARYGMTPVPEPCTLLLLGSGLTGIIGFGRKRLFKKV